MQVITDWGVALWTSLTSALVAGFSFIPRLIGFLVILLVGWLVASALERVVALLLRKVGFDRIANRIGLTTLEQRMNMRMDAAGLLAKIVYWFVFLVFLIPAVDALGLTTVSNLLNQIIAYIPNVFVAIVILFLGTLAATLVADLVRGVTASANIGNANVFANITRCAIIGFTVLVALEQLQIAPTILNILFTAIVGALALAFGLAFGLGGRESAQRWLMRGESNLTTTAARINAQQAVQQERDTAQKRAEVAPEPYTGSRRGQQPYPQQ
jgi:hypothetical protein